MNPPKCDELDYINFLTAAQKVFSAVEASKSHPAAGDDGPAHDAYTRLLYRVESDGEALWDEVKPLVRHDEGVLVIDDTTLDKPYAREMDLVTWHWSGKHGEVVKGINLISLLWTDGEARLPCDFRIYNKEEDGLTKNDHFRAMVRRAKERGFEPELVAFDSWYGALDNLKLIRDLEWDWLTQLKSNRLVDPDDNGNRPISEIDIPRHGYRVHLKGYGWIKVFKTGEYPRMVTTKRVGYLCSPHAISPAPLSPFQGSDQRLTDVSPSDQGPPALHWPQSYLGSGAWCTHS
jgi:hypothetical protein